MMLHYNKVLIYKRKGFVHIHSKIPQHNCMILWFLQVLNSLFFVWFCSVFECILHWGSWWAAFKYTMDQFSREQPHLWQPLPWNPTTSLASEDLPRMMPVTQALTLINALSAASWEKMQEKKSLSKDPRIPKAAGGVIKRKASDHFHGSFFPSPIFFINSNSD